MHKSYIGLAACCGLGEKSHHHHHISGDATGYTRRLDVLPTGCTNTMGILFYPQDFSGP
jgi:hypothetical protein